MTNDGLTRRDFLRLVGAGSATLALANCLGGAQSLSPGKSRPNILIILADDLGYGEIGCRTNPGGIPTPNINSIAKKGVCFTNAYVSCPVCSPTRAGLMTGRYQQRFGHELNPGPLQTADSEFGLPLSETTLASRFQTAGYRTGLVGKWHLGYDEKHAPTHRGFDEFFGFLGGAHPYVGGKHIYRGGKEVGEEEYLTDAFGREAVSFIDRHKGNPFFLYLAFNAVHGPLQAPEKYLNRFPDIKQKKRQTFAAMLTAMDDNVGRVLKALRDYGLEENTLVFFLSDNGGPTQTTTSGNTPLRGFKGQVYEGGIRIPYMMQWKGQVPAGSVCDKPVIQLDIAPTALAAAGIKADNARFDGVNIVPYVTGVLSGVPHQALYWRFGDQSAIRKGNWKLVKYKSRCPELCDLAADIGESKNLAEKNPEKVKELDAQLMRWDAQLIEPLWHKNKRPRAKRRVGARAAAGTKL